MIDQVTIKIEEIYLETGSYIDAIIEFANKFNIQDYEDILEVVNPILKEKIKQEFIDKNYFPDKKKQTSITDFFKSV